MHTVYAIKSLNRNYIYVGMTTDLTTRLNYYNRGHNKTTRAYRPFNLIYTEEHSNRPRAREREKYLKSGTGKEFLKSLWT